MTRSRILIIVLLLAGMWQTAYAHFLWVDTRPTDGGRRAEVCFGETAGPCDKHLLSQIAHTKVWLRDADGKIVGVPIELTEAERAALAGKYEKTTPASLEAYCDFGVYSHGGPGVRLYYYAKHLPAGWVNDPKLSASPKLRYDLVPSVADEKLIIHVTFDGKPAAQKEVVVIDPEGMRHILKSNDQGTVVIPDTQIGRYLIRTGNINANQAGEYGGKQYVQVWHYATLIFDVPDSLAAGGTPK